MSLLLRSGPLLDASMVVKVTQSSTSSSYLNQLTCPSYVSSCLENQAPLPQIGADCQGYLFREGNRDLLIGEDLSLTGPWIYSEKSKCQCLWIDTGLVLVDCVVYPEKSPLAPLYHGCNGSLSYAYVMCDMKGLEPKWCCMEINGSEKQNRCGGEGKVGRGGGQRSETHTSENSKIRL